MSTQEVIIWFEETPQAWYENIDRLFVNICFKRCEFDQIIYVLHVDSNALIVVVYVDELVLARNNFDLIFRLRRRLANTFEMTYLGILHFFFGLQVLPISYGLFFSQSKYVMDMLNHFKIDDCKACATPY